MLQCALYNPEASGQNRPQPNGKKKTQQVRTVCKILVMYIRFQDLPNTPWLCEIVEYVYQIAEVFLKR